MIKKYPLVFIAFLCSFFYGFGQVFNNDCSTLSPASWTFNSVTQNSGYWLLNDNGDYVISETFGAYDNLVLVSNLRSFSTGSAPECTVEISDDGGVTWTAGSISFSSLPNTYANYTFNIGTLSGTNNKIRWRRTSGTRGVRISNLLLTGDVISSAPSITIAPTTLTGFTYEEGVGPSGDQSFTVEGSNLNDDIDVTPPTGWELSTGTGVNFDANIANPITLSPNAGGTVVSTTLYTRMASGLLNINSPFSGNIEGTSVVDILTETTAVDGTVTIPSSCSIEDDFNRANNSTIGNGWTEVGGDANISANQLVLGTGGASGRDYIRQDVSGAYNTIIGNLTNTITWEFNMRHSRTNPAGMGGGSYGAAFILGGTNNDITQGNGYAVVHGNSGTTDYIRLVRFANGIDADGNLTNVITGNTDYGDEHLSIRVTYDPSNDNWELFVRNDGGSFASPSTLNGAHSQGTQLNNTYVNLDLRYVSALWNHSSSNSPIAEFDNVCISAVASSAPEIQLVDNMATNQDCNNFTINFGNVASDGSFSDLTFDIENVGSADLNISSLNLTAGDFTIISPTGVTPATPLVISDGGSPVTVTVRFTPTSDATLTSVLTITSNDIDEGSCAVNLTGVGFTPGPNIIVRGVIASNPTIANGSTTPFGFNNTLFGTRVINSTNQTKSFRIGNEGSTADLTVSNITLTGDTADFFVTSSFTNPFAIDTFQDFTITFQPTTLSGTRSVTVSVANSDPNKNPYTFVVQGTAECPTVSGTISPLDGPPGTTVTIISPGNDLTGASATLNNVGLNTVSSSVNELVVRLPNTITTGGPLSVQLSSGCIFSNSFTLLDETNTSCQTSSSGTVSDLFISEITDSPTGSLTYIELYNATGATINFGTTNYFIRIYNNGQTGFYNGLTLNSGTVANNSTYVISTGVAGAQCDNTTYPGADGNFSQIELNTVGASINFAKNGNENIGHDYIGLYSTAAVDAMTNPEGEVDAWGAFGNETWAVGLGLGEKGANFQRETSATIPNRTFSTSDWQITDWSDVDCGDVDYSTIGDYTYSTGVAPSVTMQPNDPTFACSFSATMSVTGIEGNTNGGPPDLDLAYQWYYSAPGDSSWTVANAAPYSGYNTSTLNISDTANLDGYQYYCQVREDTNTCYAASNAVVLDVRSSVWNGTNWSTTPASDRIAIIDGDYNTGNGTNGQTSFEACSLIVNAGNTLTVSNGKYVLVQNNVTVKGSNVDDPNIKELIVDTQGSFVQVDDSGTFTLEQYAKSQVNKTTAPLATLYNYTYWSSPVKDALIGAALFTANPNRLYYFDASAFQDPDGDGIDDIGDDWKLANLVNTMEVGRGYASTHTNIGFVPGNSYDYNFAGEFNTGIILEPLSYNPANTTDHWNLVGNPYPSAIRARGANSLFSGNANTIIKHEVFMWSQYRPYLGSNPGNQNLNFSQDDYITINITGPVGNGSDLNGDLIPDVPDDYIPSGQSFFVSSLDATNLTFNNSMRITGEDANNQFFEPNDPNQESNNLTDERLWLNLISDNGATNQLLVGYVNGATDDFDLGYDTKRNLTANGTTVIYTGINDISNEKFVIQGKNISSINKDEIIPVGFKTSINVPTIFTFSLIKFEGSFLENNIVYVKDNLLNTIHNIKESDYNFTSEVGEFNNRFEIVFTEDALSIGDVEIDDNTLQIIELQNGDVQFKVSSQFEMKSIEIIDLLGRTLYKLDAQGNSQTFSLSNLSQAAYLAKVELTNGYIITKKALKRK